MLHFFIKFTGGGQKNLKICLHIWYMNGPKDNGFTNLESFQKKMLKQKLKKLNNNPANMNTTGPYPSPPPAPQRVPNPARKNLQHAAGLLQPSTPLLPRRALNKGLLGGHPGATPTSTPNPTPNQKRRGLNALLQQYSQQQNQVCFSLKYFWSSIWIFHNLWRFHQIVSPISNDTKFLTNICYDFFFKRQTEKKTCFGSMRKLFSYNTYMYIEILCQGMR